jgi:hypothetical protein
MLQRNTQVGEFYRMRAPSIKWPEGKKEGHENYLVRRRRQTPRSRFFATRCSPPAPPQPQDIVIYNEDSDMHVHIPFAEALEASCIFEGNDEAWGFTKKQLIDNAAAGIWMPVSLVIARPFIEHRMMSAIMAVAGSDTGATLFGPADMQISANTSVKTIEGHYTCHTKSVITKPQNVMVLRDIMCNGYVAGCNTAFFGAKDPKAADKEYSKEQIQADINTRLTMADGDEVDYPSMLAFYEDYNEAAKRDQVISISNRVLPWDTTNGDTRDQFPGGKTGWDLSSGKGLEGIHYGAPRCSERPLPAKPTSVFHPASAARAQARTSAPPRIKILLRRRRSTTRSASSARTASTRRGARRTRSSCRARATLYATASNPPPVPQRCPRPTTHPPPSAFSQGPDALPGDARWRRGESVSRESARNAMTGVEAATHSQLVFQRRGASA